MREMVGKTKVKIIKRDTIKPSSPTPCHLKLFKLSFLDQIAPNSYTSLVLFRLRRLASSRVRVAHKLVDEATLCMFLKAWAAFALGCGEKVVPDLNAAASQFQPKDQPLQPPAADGDFKRVECVTKRIVFDKSKIAALKAKTVSHRVKQPTRVEAVTALVWKCAIIASRLNSSTSNQNSILAQLVNFSKRSNCRSPKTPSVIC